MPRTTGYVEAKGLREALRAIGVFDEKVLQGLLEAPMRYASERVAVPAIKAKAPSGPPPHTSAARGKRGRKGPLSRNVTVQKAQRRRGDEITAVNVGPRAWYRHFVIQGTERHSLAKGARRDAGRYQDRPPIHPGSKANDFVQDAVRSIGPAMSAELSNAPMSAYKRALGKRVII